MIVIIFYLYFSLRDIKPLFSKKIESLGRLYCGSSKYFPLEFLVRQLELLSCREGGDPAWVPVCLQVSQRSLHVLFTGTDADTIPEPVCPDQ